MTNCSLSIACLACGAIACAQTTDGEGPLAPGSSISHGVPSGPAPSESGSADGMLNSPSVSSARPATNPMGSRPMPPVDGTAGRSPGPEPSSGVEPGASGGGAGGSEGPQATSSSPPADSSPASGGAGSFGGAGGSEAITGGAGPGGSGSGGDVAMGGSSGEGPDDSDAPFTRSQTVRVMPFGDSTTATGCWRKRLWEKLQADGYTNIDFVGSGDSESDCSAGWDGGHEGHSGELVTNVTEQDVQGWATANPADVVLFHWATNDVWSNVATATILEAYTRMVNGLRVGNPNVIVLVAQIIPVAPGECGDCPNRTIALNDAIPGWAESVTTEASKVLVVDQWTGFNPATGTVDGVHPYTAVGEEHISQNWYDALMALYSD